MIARDGCGEGGFSCINGWQKSDWWAKEGVGAMAVVGVKWLKSLMGCNFGHGRGTRAWLDY